MHDSDINWIFYMRIVVSFNNYWIHDLTKFNLLPDHLNVECNGYSVNRLGIFDIYGLHEHEIHENQNKISIDTVN